MSKNYWKKKHYKRKQSVMHMKLHRWNIIYKRKIWWYRSPIVLVKPSLSIVQKRVFWVNRLGPKFTKLGKKIRRHRKFLRKLIKRVRKLTTKLTKDSRKYTKRKMHVRKLIRKLLLKIKKSKKLNYKRRKLKRMLLKKLRLRLQKIKKKSNNCRKLSRMFIRKLEKRRKFILKLEKKRFRIRLHRYTPRISRRPSKRKPYILETFNKKYGVTTYQKFIKQKRFDLRQFIKHRGYRTVKGIITKQKPYVFKRFIKPRKNPPVQRITKQIYMSMRKRFIKYRKKFIKHRKRFIKYRKKFIKHRKRFIKHRKNSIVRKTPKRKLYMLLLKRLIKHKKQLKFNQYFTTKFIKTKRKPFVFKRVIKLKPSVYKRYPILKFYRKYFTFKKVYTYPINSKYKKCFTNKKYNFNASLYIKKLSILATQEKYPLLKNTRRYKLIRNYNKKSSLVKNHKKYKKYELYKKYPFLIDYRTNYKNYKKAPFFKNYNKYPTNRNYNKYPTSRNYNKYPIFRKFKTFKKARSDLSDLIMLISKYVAIFSWYYMFIVIVVYLYPYPWPMFIRKLVERIGNSRIYQALSNAVIKILNAIKISVKFIIFIVVIKPIRIGIFFIKQILRILLFILKSLLTFETLVVNFVKGIPFKMIWKNLSVQFFKTLNNTKQYSKLMNNKILKALKYIITIVRNRPFCKKVISKKEAFYDYMDNLDIHLLNFWLNTLKPKISSTITKISLHITKNLAEFYLKFALLTLGMFIGTFLGYVYVYYLFV